MSSRPLNRGIVAIVGVVAVGQLVYYGAFWAYPPAGAALLITAGRGPDCDRWEALKAYYRHYQSRSIENKIVAASRVSSADADGYQSVETPMGSFWEPAIMGGSSVLAQVAEVQSKYYGFPGRPLRPGDVVLDCGANVGIFTRAALTAGAAIVVAIEPVPKNIVCLRRNFAREIAEGRVVVVEKGVWDREDFLQLSENDDTPARDSFVRHENTHTGPSVPLTTIDGLVRELSLPRVDFIKMDIEGAEQRALTGAVETLEKYHPRLEISVNHLPEDPVQVPIIIKRAWPGYTVECLRCEPRQDWRVAAEILFFY